MLNWIDEQRAKQRFDDIIRTAEHDRQVSLMLSAKPRRARFYNPILASLGRRLVAWGYLLQLRYDPIIDMPVASHSQGKAPQC
jgi:hypothetical protein